ncbi:hypothetical protein ACJRO7_031847 [Eucalyptus globulus]|uniref:Uncharacterized protein n=1 Tax=Eucalyptus globulus TaxID=34317 RepID=A0ABD3JJA8_EUCGL
MASADSQLQPRNGHGAIPLPELKLIECDCCGLAEECTLEYIERAMKDEAVRSDGSINGEEFQSSSLPVNLMEDLISAVKQLLRRTLDSLRKSGSACRLMMVQSKSCFSALSK